VEKDGAYLKSILVPEKSFLRWFPWKPIFCSLNEIGSVTQIATNLATGMKIKVKDSRIPIGELEPNISTWLRLASNHVARTFQKKIEIYSVTLAEFEVLRLVDQFGVSTRAELGQLVGLSKGAMSKLLTRLVDKGLVARFDDEDDGRSHLLRLTLDGRNLLPKLLLIAELIEQQSLEGLSESERSALLIALRKMVSMETIFFEQK